MVSCEPGACIPASHASSSAVVANLQEHIIRDCPQTVYITIEQVDSRRRKWLEADGWELLPGFGLVLRSMPTNCRIWLRGTSGGRWVQSLRRGREIPFPYAAQRAERDGQGAGEEEDQIPDHAQPFQLVVGAAHQERQAAGVPIPVGDGIPEPDYSSGEQIQDDHECEAYICAPETHPDELLRLLPCGVGLHGSQAEDQDSQGQHPKDTEQCGVCVI